MKSYTCTPPPPQGWIFSASITVILRSQLLHDKYYLIVIISNSVQKVKFALGILFVPRFVDASNMYVW